MHYHFYHQVHRRAADGIHWNPDAVRMQVSKNCIKFVQLFFEIAYQWKGVHQLSTGAGPGSLHKLLF